MTRRVRYGLASQRADAFERLSLPPEADAAAIKQGYRRATRAHPPDTDPDGFREVRAAYERLADPWKEAKSRLRSRQCFAEPPALAARAPVVRHALALDLLRAAVARMDRALLEDEGSTPR